MTARRINSGDVGEGDGTEVHGVRRLVLSDTPKADTMTGVYS